MLPGEKKDEVLGEIREMLHSLQSQDPLFQYRMEEMDFAEPSEVNSEEEIVRTGVEAIENVTGKKPILKGSSGFTDARFYINRCHIPTLIFGPGGTDQSHTTDESVEVDALVRAAHIYAMILVEYLSKKDEP
jgi:acetylornithine deacetylase/succinyl-diaminopimelate desuccinylase-like protein